ncbi:MAG: outer membrane beta-barrel protein [Bacteroidales bacterium]|nr:outer membrane beta-barrel protein [Bacteroidales bacterium]
MKKIMLLAIMVMTAIMANAQISVQAGYVLNTCKTKVSPDKNSNSYNGIMVAADYNLNLVGNLSVAPGLGLDYSFENDKGEGYKYKYRELGLFAPVDVNYSFPISDAFSLSLFAGPTFYYGLLSKDVAEKPSYNYYSDDNKRFDLFLGGGLWCDINETIRIKAGYKLGVTNNCKIEGIKERNNFFSLSVGFLF